MSRIPLDNDAAIPLHEVPGVARMESLFRVMAHRPNLMEQSMRLLETAMRSGTVDPKLKELLAIRVSQVNDCFY